MGALRDSIRVSRAGMPWILMGLLLLFVGSCDDSTGGGGQDLLGDSQDDQGDQAEVEADLGEISTDTTDSDTQVQPDSDQVDEDGLDTADSDTGCPVDRLCQNDCCGEGFFCINGLCQEGCSSAILCGPTQGLCCSPGDSCKPDNTCGLVCEDERDPCGTGISESCCATGEVCLDGRCETDCGDLVLCGDICCAEGQVCESNSCIADCPSADRLCGVNSELCCDLGDVCYGDACVELGDDCTLTEECEIDEYCEPTLGACIGREYVEVCEYRPPVGEFTPQMGCHWVPSADGPYPEYKEVVMTPSVANLTDDNEDGVTDVNDMPDIVFTSYDYTAQGCCTPNGILRVVSGGCVDGNLETLFTLDGYLIDNSSGIALGNLHPDTDLDEKVPEIVALERHGALALRRVADDGSNWEVMWYRANIPSTEHSLAGAIPNIADLNGDGQPEVIIGNVVLNGLDGATLFDGLDLDPAAGIGNNAFLGPASTVADIDLDGIMEVIAGNTVYEWNGSEARIECQYEYTTSNSDCHGSLGCDGFNAVGNFDADLEGEIVIVREGQIFILEHDCVVKHIIDVPYDTETLGDGPCTRNESGPPTVADFDGDGRPEVGTAGADFYVVADLDCVGDPLPEGCDSEMILWKALNHDCSSRATASSVFDFEGDGKAEVVYADERDFFIFDGTDGSILYQDDTHSSNTRIEMPVIVDVDNDGKSEIIIPEPNRNSDDLGGIEIWEDASNNWVRTRRIWNQHGYHVTNITEDGQVPRNEEPNWLNSRLNNYRQNVQPGGLFDAPNLYVLSAEVNYSQCATNTVTIVVTVGNDGALGVPAGIDVIAELTLTSTGETFDLGVQQTSEGLLPGQSTTVSFEWTQTGLGQLEFTVNATVDMNAEGEQAVQ